MEDRLGKETGDNRMECDYCGTTIFGDEECVITGGLTFCDDDCKESWDYYQELARIDDDKELEETCLDLR